jgi:signal transduction histidine kinase
MLRANTSERATRAKAAREPAERADTSRKLERQAEPEHAGLRPARFAERHLANLLHCFDQALALFDAQDRLQVCNAAYRDLFAGEIAAKLAGRHYEQLLDAWITGLQFASEQEVADFRMRRLLERREEQSNFDVLTRTGRCLRVSDRCAPDGTLLTTIYDRTEDERLLAEQREARRVAETASARKSEFLCSMSHELRTPLNVILGFGQLLQRDLKLPLPERHRSRVAQIMNGGHHLLRIIEDLLDLSRIEVGRLSVSPEPVDICAVLEDLQTTLGPSATSAGVRLEVCNTAGGAIPMISADPIRYAQILFNFGSNAIKYNRPNGKVSFSVTVPCTECVRVSVRDTGIGIPADRQATLFHAFQRAGQEVGAIEGTGLGLVITKRLAELMQGSVGFCSVQQQGSEFWVDMPVDAGRDRAG